MDYGKQQTKRNDNIRCGGAGELQQTRTGCSLPFGKHIVWLWSRKQSWHPTRRKRLLQHKRRSGGFAMNDNRQLYLDHLHGTIQVEGTARGRVRSPGQYKEIVSTAKNRFVDVMREMNDNMDNVHIWSDQHFGHENIIRYSNRPFRDKFDMDEQLVANHNEVVGENDICLWLGDIAFMKDHKANMMLRRCNGYKILIVGNHDMQKKQLKKLDVDEFHLTYEITGNIGINYLFTHYPLDEVPPNTINIHGHTHTEEDQSDFHINVSVERIDYRPVLLRNVLAEGQMRILKNT